MHDHDELERVGMLLPARHRARWSLFTDWCIGIGATPIPADRETLIGFVRANPAALSTQRERLAAVRAAHMHAQVPVPAKANARAVRSGGGHEWPSSEAAQVVAALPSAGWPSGLFGRRDALLLVLSKAAGMSYGQIERLQRSQVRVVNSTLQVQVGQVWIQVPANADPRMSPAAVFLRWARLLAYVDRWPSTAAVAAALAKAQPMTAQSQESYAALPQVVRDGPLVVPIDRWGGLGMGRWRQSARARWGLSATAIGEIVASHLSGNGGRHVGSGWDGLPRMPELEDEPDSPPVSTLSDVDPAVGWHARARAQEQLANVRETLNDVEREAEALAARIAAILANDNE